MKNLSLTDTQRFYEFMLKYATKLESIEKAQTIKLNTLVGGSLKNLEKSISEQQASIMEIEGVEKKRLALQEELGLEGLTFKELLPYFDASFSDRLKELIVRIETSVYNTKFANEKAMDYAKEVLDVMSTPQNLGYNEEASKVKPSSGSFLQTKI